jgi:hypothetical protein
MMIRAEQKKRGSIKKEDPIGALDEGASRIFF